MRLVNAAALHWLETVAPPLTSATSRRREPPTSALSRNESSIASMSFGGGSMLFEYEALLPLPPKPLLEQTRVAELAASANDATLFVELVQKFNFSSLDNHRLVFCHNYIS